MDGIEKFKKLLEKEVIPLSQIRDIAESDYVSLFAQEKEDKRYPGYHKYRVELNNGDLYWIYLKHENLLKQKIKNLFHIDD